MLNKQKLNDSTTKRMKKLREEGYTNSQIADMLETSYRTVYKQIGRMPMDMFHSALSEAGKIGNLKWQAMKKEMDSVRQIGIYDLNEANEESRIRVVGMDEDLEGKAGRYSIDYTNKNLHIIIDCKMTFAQLDALAMELEAVRQRINRKEIQDE